MKNFIKKIVYSSIGLFLPIISSAQNPPAAAGGGQKRSATQILDMVTDVIQQIIPIVIGLALLVFIWGVLKYVLNSSDAGKAQGRTFMLWGIVSLFVMVAVWGLVFLLQDAFLGKTDPSQPPQQQIDQMEKLPESEGSGLAGGSPILDVLKEFGDIVAAVIPVLILIALVVFLWGVFRYAFSPDAKSKETARTFMVWGIIALFVMVSVWGAVIMLQQTIFKSANPAELGSSGEAVKEMTQDPKIEGGGASGVGGGGVNDAIVKVMDVVQSAIPLLVTIGTLLFIWGVFKYTSTENAKKKSEALAYISWGVILLLVMAAVWGFVKLIGDSTGVKIDSQQEPTHGKVNVQSLIKK